MDYKSIEESQMVMTQLMLPSHSNFSGRVHGGFVLSLMDQVAFVCASKHSGHYCVTASVNHVVFSRAVPVGSVLTIEAKVSRAFHSSMEIFVDVWMEDRESGERTKVNEGIYTFVAVDRTGAPVKVPGLIPQTDLEKERYDGALRRKQLSLVLSKKMDPHDATELKALFT